MSSSPVGMALNSVALISCPLSWPGKKLKQVKGKLVEKKGKKLTEYVQLIRRKIDIIKNIMQETSMKNTEYVAERQNIFLFIFT